MPRRSKSPCSAPGCSVLTRNGRCPKHRNYTDTRKPPQKRGYDHRWRRLRTAYARAHPVCQIREKCDGDPVEEVDHIIPITEAPEKRLDWENLQSACRRCHNWKTREIDGKR